GKVLFNRFVGPTFLGIAGDDAVAEQGLKELGPVLDYLEGQCGDGWLTGGDFSIGDVSVASGLRSLGYVGLEPETASHPRAAAWYERVKARPSWQKVAAVEAKIMNRVLAT
ncbi:MAG: glutathione S-transferase family protein, partial [Sphingomonadales bacterium]|nr:glutathione S-transferase family protein [Sphingomonadales bacterium]